MSSNPFITGGGGFSFENYVQAMTLIDLVCGSFTRVFSSCPVQSVGFQTNRLGYETDDMLVQGIDPSIGKNRKLLYQIKHGISFIRSSGEWAKCIGDFWRDFNNASLFDRNCDALVVAVAGLDNADAHFAKTLELLRMGNAQTSTKTDRSRFDNIRSVVNGLNEDVVCDDEFDQFVRCIHVIQYGDLDSWESLSDDSRIRKNPELWNEALEIASRANSQGASLTLSNLQSSFIQTAGINACSNSLMIVRDHSDRLMQRIEEAIAGQYVNREEKEKEFGLALDSGGVVFVIGDAGTGKSALVKRCLTVDTSTAIVWLTSKDLDHGSLEEAARSLGIQDSLRAVAYQLSLNQRVVVVVDSMERLIQGSDVTCLKDLIDACRANSWHFIGVLRSYSFGWLPDRLDLNNEDYCRVDLDVFSEQELAVLEAANSNLGKLSLAKRGGSFFRNPYNLSMLSIALDESDVFDSMEDSAALRQRLWSLIVERVRDGAQPHSRERGDVFESICMKRASNLAYAVSCENYDKAIIDNLCSANLLELVNGNDYTVSHDVLEDWGVYRYFDRWYTSQNTSNSDVEFLAGLRNQPGMGRAFASWLGERIASDESSIAFVRGLIGNSSINKPVRRFCIIAAIESGQLGSLLDSFEYGLFRQDDSVFALVVSTLRLCAVEAKPTLGVVAEAGDDPKAPISFIPRGHAWGQVFSFAFRNIGKLDRKSCRECIGALKEWSVGNAREKENGSDRRAAGLLSLELLKRGYGREDYGWAQNTLASVATGCYTAIADEYLKALQLDEQRSKISEVAQELRRDAVFGMGSYSLARDNPGLLANLVRLEFYADEAEELGATNYYDYEDLLFDAHYGLGSDALEHCLAHGRRPPFFGLFNHAPKVATELCVEVCNHIGSAVAVLPADGRDGVEVSILKGDCPTDGCRTVLVSTDMWCAYRGMGIVPPHIQSMLMSLENYLIALVESDSEEAHKLFLRMYDHVLLKGETALTLGVAASLAEGFPSIVGEHCLPLFSAPDLFFADSARMSQEKLSFPLFTFAPEDKMVYEVDRVPSNKRKWRTIDLERLCIHLQLSSEYRESIICMIKSFPEDNPWLKALKGKLDSSGFSVSPGEEPGSVILTPPDVDLGEEIELWYDGNTKALTLYDWSRKTLDNINDADRSVDELFWTARELEETDVEEASHSINMFCAAVVRAGLLDSGPCEMHGWCCEKLLDGCESVLSGLVDVARMGVELTNLDCCLEVAPLLLRDESAVIRDRARQCITKGFMSESKSIAVSVARGIAAYLWDIDSTYARELLDDRIRAPQRLDEVVRNAGVRYRGETRTVLLTACPANNDERVHEKVTALFSDAIAAEKYDREHYEDRRRFREVVTNDVSKDGPAGLIAKYLFDLRSVDEFAPLLKRGAKEAPEFVHSILTYLAGRAAEAGDHLLRWMLVEAIEDELVEIALDSPNDTSSPWARLLIRALYGDADWQPLDYEQQNVRYGKGAVLEIASRAGSSAAVLQSLARLMFHFPLVFSVECMEIVNGISDERLEQLFEHTVDLMFCLIAWLRTFVLKKKDAEITREQYECCLRVLDIAIESGSREAHFTRDSFINKRWRFTRG